jgi:hypothetical protein
VGDELLNVLSWAVAIGAGAALLCWLDRKTEIFR